MNDREEFYLHRDDNLEFSLEPTVTLHSPFLQFFINIRLARIETERIVVRLNIAEVSGAGVKIVSTRHTQPRRY